MLHLIIVVVLHSFLNTKSPWFRFRFLQLLDFILVVILTLTLTELLSFFFTCSSPSSSVSASARPGFTDVRVDGHGLADVLEDGAACADAFEEGPTLPLKLVDVLPVRAPGAFSFSCGRNE